MLFLRADLKSSSDPQSVASAQFVLECLVKLPRILCQAVADKVRWEQRFIMMLESLDLIFCTVYNYIFVFSLGIFASVECCDWSELFPSFVT